MTPSLKETKENINSHTYGKRYYRTPHHYSSSNTALPSTPYGAPLHTLLHSIMEGNHTINWWIYRWVPLKLDFLGAWKSVWLKHYPTYPIIVISLIMQRNLATKIRAKRESGLTTVWLKQDPPVIPCGNVLHPYHPFLPPKTPCIHKYTPNSPTLHFSVAIFGKYTILFM